MKKSLIFPFVAALFFAGCSQEETEPVVVPGQDDVQTNYMSVKLMSADAGSRAASGYEDGTSRENDVTKVRFYFFTADGSAADVKPSGTSYVNFYDWAPSSQSQAPDENDDIEKKLDATIVINTKKGDKLPQMVAAVLNPTTDLDNTSKSLDELKAMVYDYAWVSEDANIDNRTTIGKFVMFNSVYSKDGAEFCAVPIEAGNLQETEEKAIKNPVILFVERCVAKVKVANELGENNTSLSRIPLKNSKDGTNITVNGKQIYLELGGWGLTAEASDGRLVKKIETSWNNSWWNGSHRSFWAVNSTSATNVYHDYNNIGKGFGNSDYDYTNENAEKNNAANDKNTKVIIKGTLCDENGQAITLVRHMGTLFVDQPSTTETENLPELKKSILSQLALNGKTYYYQVTEGDNTVRKQIDADDLMIVVATPQEYENSDNNCYVHAKLTAAAEKKEWYASAEATDAATADDINKALASKATVNPALVWNSGMTYYFFDIKHLPESGKTGVVRNHVYDTRVTKIAGLGTPVYDPDEIIYPEKPSDNDHFIAAKINILSWRIVTQDYEIEW